MKNFIQLQKHQNVELLSMVNKNYDTTEHNDLNVNNAEFESTWIEIKNKNSKNICGSIDIHTIILMNFSNILNIKKSIFVVIITLIC